MYTTRYSPLQRGEVPPVLLSASVSNNSGNSPKVAAPRMPCEIDQSTQRFHVGYDWGPIRCGETKCLVSLHVLCCHLWRDITNNTLPRQSLGGGFLYQESAVGRVTTRQLQFVLSPGTLGFI